jgi:predicted esterase
MSEIQQHHLPVQRTARFYSLGPWQSVSQLWIVLHGHSQLARALLHDVSPLDNGRRLIVAPEALSRFYLETSNQGRHSHKVGATWMTREDREAEIADYVAYLDRLIGHVEDRLGGLPTDARVLGFSQGGATAARWEARGSRAVPGLVLWGSLCPGDVLPSLGDPRWQSRTVTLVLGKDDSLVSPDLQAAQLAELQRFGIRSREHSFAGGHRLDGELLVALADDPLS